MHRLLSVASALSALSVLGVAAQDFGCVNKFIDESRNVFATFGCSNASDGTCLCQNDNFKYSIRDSAVASCSVSEEQAMTYLSDTFCLGVPLDGESQAPTTAAPTSETPTTAPTSSETVAETPTTTEPTSTEPVTSDQPSETSSAPEGVTSTSSPTTDTAASTETSSSETSEAAATQTNDADAEETEENEDDEAAAVGGGLSQGAAVGIGVGVAVVFIAVAAIVVVILMRNRKRKQQTKRDRNLDISRPMPGPGRTLGSVDHNSFEKRGMDSIEMVSNRYEDMLPRQTPRTMRLSSRGFPNSSVLELQC